MPFTKTGSAITFNFNFEEENSSETVTERSIGIDISEVNQESERLSIILTGTEGGDEYAFRYKLADDEAGNTVLQLDTEHTDSVIIEELAAALSSEFGLSLDSPWIIRLYRLPSEDSELFWTLDPMAVIITIGDDSYELIAGSEEQNAPEVLMRIENYVIA